MHEMVRRQRRSSFQPEIRHRADLVDVSHDAQEPELQRPHHAAIGVPHWLRSPQSSPRRAAGAGPRRPPRSVARARASANLEAAAEPRRRRLACGSRPCCRGPECGLEWRGVARRRWRPARDPRTARGNRRSGARLKRRREGGVCHSFATASDFRSGTS